MLFNYKLATNNKLFIYNLERFAKPGWGSESKERREGMAKKGLIKGKPTTHNARDMVRIKKLKQTIRQARKVARKIEGQARQLKEDCIKVLKDLDTGWES